MKIFLAGHKKKERQHYRYGVAIINFWFQFKFKKNRTFDFLLDGQGLNKDNTIFLFLRDFDKKIYKQLLSQGYNLMNCRTRSILCSKKPSLDRETAKSLIEKYFSIWRNNLIFILWEADFMVRCTNILLLEHFRWNVVLNNVKVDNFIIPNDGDIRHIGRNVLLKKQSTKAWCYSQSSSAGHLKAHKDEDMIKYWNHLWSYLFYDFYLAPDERFIEYQKLHRQNIKEYINIGSIWSSYISANTHGLSNFLKKENIKKTADKDSKILAVFDTTYMEGIGSKGPLKRAIKFYEHMLGLLDSNRDFFIIAKEKKPSSWYSSPSSISYSNFHKEYSSILIKVKEHPRACLAGVNADPTEIISLSDLVITHVFSSSTVEALGGGRKAIYYDPMDEFKDCYYANIPNLIAHGYEQLKDLTNKLLYEMSEQEYREYLHKHVKGKLEGFIDGQALARFRKLLVAK